jgi:hypothetical protein
MSTEPPRYDEERPNDRHRQSRGYDHRGEREFFEGGSDQVGESARVDGPQDTADRRPEQKLAVRIRGEAHRCVDDESQARDEATHDEEHRSARTEEGQCGSNLVVLPQPFEPRLDSFAGEPCDPVDGGVAGDRSQRARNHHRDKVERAMRREG